MRRLVPNGLLLDKSLAYPGSAYEDVVVSSSLSSAYFAAQQDAQPIFDQNFQQDQQNLEDFWSSNNSIETNTWMRVCRGRWNRLPEYNYIYGYMLFAVAQWDAITYARLALTNTGAVITDTGSTVALNNGDDSNALMRMGRGSNPWSWVNPNTVGSIPVHKIEFYARISNLAAETTILYNVEAYSVALANQTRAVRLIPLALHGRAIRRFV